MPLHIKQILTVTCLAAFIFFVSAGGNYIDVDMDRIVSAVSETAKLEHMSELDGSYVRKDFGINVNDYPEYVYYGHESVMDSETLLVVKVMDSAQADEIISFVEKSRDRDMELFKSYAPDQYDMLSRSILEQKGNYVIYVVSDNAHAIEQAINGVLTGKE